MELVGPIHTIPVRSDCPPWHPTPSIVSHETAEVELIELVQFDNQEAEQVHSTHEEATAAFEEKSVRSENSGVETIEVVEEKFTESAAEAVSSVPSDEKSADVHVEEILVEPELAEVAEPPQHTPHGLLEEIKRL